MFNKILLQVFPGNYDRHSIVTHEFVPAFHARLVKIHPLSYNVWRSMRIELYGCPIKVRLTLLKNPTFFNLITHSLSMSYTLATGIGVVRSCFKMMYNLMIFFIHFIENLKKAQRKKQVDKQEDPLVTKGSHSVLED